MLDLSVSADGLQDQDEVLGMSKGRQVLSDDHARALIKQAIGMIFGDTKVEAGAATEIAAIEAQHQAGPITPAIAPDSPGVARIKTPLS